jgi:hypothetical protein
MSVFYALAVKFVLIATKFSMYKVKSNGQWEIEELNLGAFMFNFSLIRTLATLQSFFLLESLSDMRQRDAAPEELQLSYDAARSELV